MIILLMFAFAFIFPSFTIPQDIEKREVLKVTRTRDSVFVNVQFQNPEVILKDDRMLLDRRLSEQELNGKELVNVVREGLEMLSSSIVLQERRNEPIVAHLQQKTGYSIGQINRFISLNSATNLMYGIVSALFMVLLITLYNTSYRRLKETTTSLLLLVISIWGLSMVVINKLLPLCYGNDYNAFYHLLKISPEW